MWIKAVVGLLAVAFCVLIGYLAAERYRARAKFFSQLADFNERYLGELAYTRRPLSAFLADGKYAGDFELCIGKLKKRETPDCKFSYLTAEEERETKDYFSALGRGDSASQHAYCAARSAAFSQKKEEAQKEEKTRSSLYLKLGLLAGLAFVIVML